MFLTQKERKELQYWKNSGIEHYEEFTIPDYVFDCFDKEFFISFGNNISKNKPEEGISSDNRIPLGNDTFRWLLIDNLEGTGVFDKALLSAMMSNKKYKPILNFFQNKDKDFQFGSAFHYDFFDTTITTIGLEKNIFIFTTEDEDLYNKYLVVEDD